MSKLKLSVEGMKCDGCASRVKNVLSTMTGVTELDVKVGSVACEYTGDKTELINKIQSLGYKVK